jgi:hypothetical protein
MFPSLNGKVPGGRLFKSVFGSPLVVLREDQEQLLLGLIDDP